MERDSTGLSITRRYVLRFLTGTQLRLLTEDPKIIVTSCRSGYTILCGFGGSFGDSSSSSDPPTLCTSRS